MTTKFQSIKSAGYKAFSQAYRLDLPSAVSGGTFSVFSAIFLKLQFRCTAASYAIPCPGGTFSAFSSIFHELQFRRTAANYSTSYPGGTFSAFSSIFLKLQFRRTAANYSTSYPGGTLSLCFNIFAGRKQEQSFLAAPAYSS